MKHILLIVDPQNDFITGTLAVKGAKEKMMKLADYIISDAHSQYDYVCVTLDSHPENHCSFKENGGIWPMHCVYDTNGWDIPEYLDDALNLSGKLVNYYHKGTEPDIEEYSIFDNRNDGNTLANQITDLIREGNIEIDICGIAGDYCVLETLKGLRNIIGDKYIRILTQYVASIDHGIKLMQYTIENKIGYVY
jgi:nicotinamidase/pyrazinamidase